MADGRYRLPCVEESLHERHRLWDRLQDIGVHHTARQQEGIEILRPSILKVQINRELASPIRQIPGANLLLLRRDERRLRPRLVQGLARLLHLDLLKPLRHQNRYSDSIELLRGHFSPPK